jgi:hypothetical protein
MRWLTVIRGHLLPRDQIKQQQRYKQQDHNDECHIDAPVSTGRYLVDDLLTAAGAG